MDPIAHTSQLVRLRRRELEAAAAAHRLARQCRRAPGGRPSRLLRLYARLWWASRPRASAWTPGLFGPHSA
ncbi:hypothetical protein [Pseudonocardia cypriaca]|uniref:Uncharacterized protein n=1 Tax=Pseudonocardia cypriaca TaxID=882449 RepID=A0A543G9Q6_9PSEU|nr:hypothetical protein [Pseudonocardia cypriaca]TQM42816.1 hypothetical protein FB388_0152 [Pseudonocardia cypriaca]